jgi:putative flippase GtrA
MAGAWSAASVRYLLVGALGTAINLASYAVMLAIGVPYALAAGLGYALGMVSSYPLQRRWTFGAGAHRTGYLVKYCVVQAAGLLGNVAVTALLVEVAGVPELPAQALSIAVVVVATYQLNRRWSFAPSA